MTRDVADQLPALVARMRDEFNERKEIDDALTSTLDALSPVVDALAADVDTLSPDVAAAVKTTVQSLTIDQQTQAQENLNVYSQEQVADTRRPEFYGALGDGTTDDSAAVQACIDAGGEVFLSAGKTYVVHGLVAKSGTTFRGSARTGTGRARMRTLNGAMFTTSGYVFGCAFRDLILDSFTGGGDIITGHWSQSALLNVDLVQYNDGYSAVNVVGWIDITMDAGAVTHTLTATVPSFKAVTATGELAHMNFSNTRFTDSGNYALWIEGQSGSVPIGIKLSNVNFENPKGGAINLLSCRNVEVSVIGMWDFTSGAATNHLVHIGKSATGGAVSRSITIKHMIRDASTAPAGGVYDIYVDPASIDAGLEISECGHQTTGNFLVSAGGVPGRLSGGRVTTLDAGSGLTVDGAWQAYTPTLGGSGTTQGNAVITGSYCRIGKTVHFQARAVLGSTTVVGTQLHLSVPVAARAAYSYSALYGTAEDTGNFFYDVSADLDSGLLAARGQARASNQSMTHITSTSPFTWNAGDAFQLRGTYEAA